MGWINEIELERARAALPEIAARYVALERKGRELVGRCPFHQDDTPSFTVIPAKGFFHCFGCGAHGDTIALVMAIERVGFHEAIKRINDDRPLHRLNDFEPGRRNQNLEARLVDPDLAAKIRRARQIWRDAAPAPGTIVQHYLEGRGITLEPPSSLRFAPSLWHDIARHNAPAIVAAVQDGAKVVGIHRTYLEPDGSSKAKRSAPPRLMLGRVGGAAVRFARPARQLFIAEGIETALSIAQATGAATWAALSAGNMVAVAEALPDEVQEAVFCMDADGGDADDRMLAQRLEQSKRRGIAWRLEEVPAGGVGDFYARLAAAVAARRGIEARVAVPPIAKGDFNDVLQGRA